MQGGWVPGPQSSCTSEHWADGAGRQGKMGELRSPGSVIAAGLGPALIMPQVPEPS